MPKRTYPYEPDYAVPPGWVLDERLEANGISQAEFARRCGRSPKLISEIVSGKAPIEAKTALQFERVLGVDAGIWLGLERDYRLHQARKAEALEAEASAAWMRGFSVAELMKRGVIQKVTSAGEKVTELLNLFGVASKEAWNTRYESMAVAYRQSKSFESKKPDLTAWLRLVEIGAEAQLLVEYDRSAFLKALEGIKQLTRAEIPQALEDARLLCNDAGVALVWVKQLPGARVSGAAWWLEPRKPVIALSARHLSDDHLWFSLFHEAAHILFHSKRNVFVNWGNGDVDAEEVEANDWAERFLLSPSAWQHFVASGAYLDEVSICNFALEQGIAPGIVLGRLQHEGLLGWDSLSHLKVRLEWSEDGSQLSAAMAG